MPRSTWPSTCCGWRPVASAAPSSTSPASSTACPTPAIAARLLCQRSFAAAHPELARTFRDRPAPVPRRLAPGRGSPPNTRGSPLRTRACRRRAPRRRHGADRRPAADRADDPRPAVPAVPELLLDGTPNVPAMDDASIGAAGERDRDPVRVRARHRDRGLRGTRRARHRRAPRRPRHRRCPTPTRSATSVDASSWATVRISCTRRSRIPHKGHLRAGRDAGAPRRRHRARAARWRRQLLKAELMQAVHDNRRR